MCDYISDTISYDEAHGLKSPDSKAVVMTTTCEGDFVCDMDNSVERASKKKADSTAQKYVRLEVNLNNAKMKPLDQRLWIDGNTSIAYGRLAGEPDGDLFSLTFFPFAQHMLSDSPGQRTHYGSTEKLRAAVEKVDFGKITGL